jgi:hypothetical protein
MEVASATVVEVGDLVCCVSNYAKTPAQLGSSAASLGDIAETFMGVSMQASASGETTPIRVATTGTFEFPCDSGSVYVGKFAKVNASALDQKVARQDTISSLCIGYIQPVNVGGVGHGAGNQTSCLVTIYNNMLNPKMDSAA